VNITIPEATHNAVFFDALGSQSAVTDRVSVKWTQWSGQGPMVGFCEDGSEFHGSTKIGNIHSTKKYERETPHTLHFIDKF
jgi:hypothetical protein